VRQSAVVFNWSGAVGEPYTKSSRNSVSFPGRAYQQYVNDNADTAQVPGFAYSSPLLWTDSFIGEKMPKWKSRIKNKVAATTSYVAYKRSATYSIGRIAAKKHLSSNPKQRSLDVVAGCFVKPSVMPAFGAPVGSAASRAAGDWFSRLRNAYSTFKGAVFTGEAREARRMMANRANQMIGMINPYQKRAKRIWRGKGSNRAKLRGLANNWLELQYGWLPLVSDIEDLNKTLNNPKPQYKIVMGFAGNTTKVRVEASDSAGPLKWLNCTQTDTSCTITHKGQARLHQDPAGGHLQDFGFHTREFLPTAWELCPWSFLVDYFTNASDIVNAVAYAQANLVWMSSTRIEEVTIKSYSHSPSCTLPNGYDLDYLSHQPSVAVSSSKQVFRTGDPVPVPNLYFQIPDMKQTVNIAALYVARKFSLFR
jgi:hypothetical protein